MCSLLQQIAILVGSMPYSLLPNRLFNFPQIASVCKMRGNADRFRYAWTPEIVLNKRIWQSAKLSTKYILVCNV